MAAKADADCLTRLFESLEELDRILERRGLSPHSPPAEAAKALNELPKGMYDEMDAWATESKRLYALALAVRGLADAFGVRLRALEAAAGIRSGALKSTDSVVARVQARILERRNEGPRR